MYQIFFDDILIFDPRQANGVQKLRLISANLTKKINESGSLVFEIPCDHPQLAQLRRLKGIVSVKESGATIFRGRIISDVSNFFNTRTITCEGLMATFNDSTFAPFSFPEDYLTDPAYIASTNKVEYFLGKIIESHNSQVDADHHLTLGTVTVTDPNNYITRSSTGFLTTWEALKTKLFESSLGGYLVPREEIGGTYIDYLSECSTINSQTIEFGKNLVDLEATVDAKDICTDILPIGANGITLAGTADGPIDSDLTKSGLIIYSASLRSNFGQIRALKTWDDVNDLTILKSKAAAFLRSVGIPKSISVKAVDLHFLDNDIAQMQVGRLTNVKSGPHGLSGQTPLIEMNIDILEPGESEMIFGAFEQVGLSEIAANTKQAVEIAGLQPGSDSDVTRLAQRVTKNELTIAQNEAEFQVHATEQVEVIGDISTKLSNAESTLTQHADEISTKVSRTDFNGQTIASEINQSAAGVKIKADKISLEGLITANGNFEIDENGNLHATNGTFSGTLTGATVRTDPAASGYYYFLEISGNTVIVYKNPTPGAPNTPLASYTQGAVLTGDENGYKITGDMEAVGVKGSTIGISPFVFAINDGKLTLTRN